MSLPNRSLFRILFLSLLAVCLTPRGIPGAEDPARFETDGMSAEFSTEDASITFRGDMPDVVIPPGGLAYEESGTWHRVLKITRTDTDGNFHKVMALDERGTPVSLTVEYSGDGSAKVSFVPTAHYATQVRLEIMADPDDHFYGMGEPWNETLDQRGQKVRMWVRTGTPDQCCFVPFYMSQRGYGLYVDQYHDGWFDFCATEGGRVTITFHDNRMDFYVIAGPSMKQIITRYCGITGFPPMPPAWSFLPWKWRNTTDRAGVMEDAHKMKELNIPIGVMMIDRPWALGPYGNNDFEFDPQRYPDAEEMIRTLNGMGMEVLVWVCEFNRNDAKNFEKGLELGAYCDGAQEGVATDPDRVGSYHIDFTNPRGFAFWKTQMQKVLDLGIAGFKLDRGQSIGDKARFASGESGYEMHNYHGYLFNKCCYEALREKRGDDFTMLPRAGWAGSQKYAAAKWPGDMSASFNNYNGLPAVVLNQQTIGLSAFPFYGSDIGGFSKKTSVHVFARWVEHGALSPVFQCPHQAWEYGDEMVRIYRKYATLHTELVPYIYHFARVAHETGIPITRALVLEYQDDPNVVKRWDEYMFGDSLLVAPVIRDENRREIYLPRGRWYDYWTGEEYEGPITIPAEEEIPLDHLPLFVRAGSVIPMEVENDVTGHGGEFSKGALTLDVYPGLMNPTYGSGAAVRESEFSVTYHLPEGPVKLKGRGFGHVKGPGSTDSKGFIINCSEVSRPVVLRVLTPRPGLIGGLGPHAREGREHGFWFYEEDTRRMYAILKPGKAHNVTLLTW